MNNISIVEFLNTTTFGNAVGFVSLLISIIGLLVSLKTLLTAKRVENKIAKEKVDIINKNRFDSMKFNSLKTLKQKREAAANAKTLSFNYYEEMLSILNDLICYKDILMKSDIEIITVSIDEIKQIMVDKKSNGNSLSYKTKYDEVTARIINILEKGEYSI